MTDEAHQDKLRPVNAIMTMLCQSVGLPTPVAEHRFCAERRWRFDYAWPERKIAIEVDGGAWVYGRHNRPAGFLRDMEKYNAATVLGWRVLRYTPAQIKNGDFLNDLMKLWQ